MQQTEQFQIELLFREMADEDLPLLHEWLNLPHVQRHYSISHWRYEEVINQFSQEVREKNNLFSYLVYVDEIPTGFAQCYPVSKYPWAEHNLTSELLACSAGVDMFIAKPQLTGLGLGHHMLSAFLDFVIWPNFDACLADPAIDNFSAIRCCEKAGFQYHATVATMNLLAQPVTLQLMIKYK